MLLRRIFRKTAWRLGAVLLLLLSFISALSCSNLGYYGQAAWGQARILAERKSIAKLVRNEATPEQLRAQLRLVERIRRFANEELLLPDNGSYRSFVELAPEADGTRRRYVVWNVVAAPELSTSPLLWCFPVVGCVSYRGYFSRARARKFAERLGRQGYDVALAGATAYSTLGWFKDPVLSTVIDYPEVQLAGLLFHELAHQLLYVEDDTRFNESFATSVEIEGVRRWLGHTGKKASLLDDYLARMRREEEFTELVLGSREQLREMYTGPLSEERKRQRKGEIFADMKRAYEKLRASWDGYGGYDAWFDRELNNAHLVSVGAYHGFVPGFQNLLEENGGDLQAFYEAVQDLGALDPAQRERHLQR